MSKKRLEEIKKLRETILEENDYRTRCVLASVFVSLGYMDYLIKQAERVQELEQQNKRYREEIERALGESGWGDEGYALNKIIGILAKVLEG